MNIKLAALRVERDAADLVDDQQRDPLQLVELAVEAAGALGVGEQRDPFGGGAERDALSGQAGADPERDREEASMSVKSRCRWSSGADEERSGSALVRWPRGGGTGAARRSA